MRLYTPRLACHAALLALAFSPDALAAPSSSQPARILASSREGAARIPPQLVFRERRVTKRPYAEISRTAFERVSPSEGRWRGFVRGNGRIRLELLIIRAGKVEYSHSIGFVQMKDGERPVLFNFRGPLPRGRAWSWKIGARAS